MVCWKLHSRYFFAVRFTDRELFVATLQAFSSIYLYIRPTYDSSDS